MPNLTPKRCGRKPARRCACLAAALLLSCSAAHPGRAAADAYLGLNDEEATKVGAGSTDTGMNAGGAGADVRRPRPSRERFEELLSERHVGTYSFYRKLPERSREEVFLDYSDGATMDALRETIVDRYLHP